MARISMGESKWRMLRRVLRKKQFSFDDARNMTRHDEEHFEWMVEKGIFAAVGNGLFTVTDVGREAADLGEYEV